MGDAENALIRYPFPLSNGQTGYVHLPREGVTHDDAERLRQMVNSLVMDKEAGHG